MTPGKRLFDILAALSLLVLLAPLMGAIALAIRLRDGAPVLHVSERMRAPGEGFRFYKFRTMRPDPADSGVSGGDKQGRITALGAFLRHTRLDELPQLWNLLRGDISAVGPRPPLRQHVERFPELYAKVLRSRPGITGLASLHFHAHEQRLLARSRSPAETEAIYCRACVPRKARLDLIYQRRRSLCLDIAIIARTLLPPLRRKARKARRARHRQDIAPTRH